MAIEFEECLKDSPAFRAQLEYVESDIDVLELKLDKTAKLCTSMVDAGKSYSTCNTAFVESLRDIAVYFKDDSFVSESLSDIVRHLKELQEFFNILLDQAHRSICKNLRDFITTDIRKVKETKKYFEKISDEMDNVLNKNAAASRLKESECDEASNSLVAHRACFSHTALDYVFQLNLLTSNAFKSWVRRWFIIQNNQLVYRKRSKDDLTVMEDDLRLCTVKKVHDQDRRFCFEIVSNTKHHFLQADTAHLCEQWISALQASIASAYSSLSGSVYSDMSAASSTLSATAVRQGDSCSTDSGASLSGVGSADAIGGGTSTGDGAKTATNNNGGGGGLPALAASQGGTGGDAPSLASAPPPKPPRQTVYQQILAIPGNDKCCDCASSEPRWASINLGITLCIACSGVHRSFGVHYSKVRSLTLDAWDPELQKVMSELGNSTVNSVLEATTLPGGGGGATLPGEGGSTTKLAPDCSGEAREAYIRAKYIEKKFMTKYPPPSLSAARLRRWSVRRSSRGDRGPPRGRTLPQPPPPQQPPPPPHEPPLLRIQQPPDEPPPLPDEPPPSPPVPSSPPPENEAPPDPSQLAEVGRTSTSVSRGSSVDPVPGQEHSVTTSSDRSQELGSTSPDDQPSTDAAGLPNIDDGSASDELGSAEEQEQDQDLDLAALSPNMLLYKAARGHNFPLMFLALCHGASPHWANPEDQGRTALHQAVLSGSVSSLEYLLLNGGRMNQVDTGRRWSALHLAVKLQHTGQVCVLLKRGADQSLQDSEGRDAVTLALRSTNADIVTLLRLARLNQEMRDTDYGTTASDDTFSEVFRDFSNLASNDPDRLRRQHTAPSSGGGGRGGGKRV